MATVKHIGSASVFRVGLMVYGILGFIAGVFCSAIAFAGVPFAPHAHMPQVAGFPIALFAVILCPLIYGIIGGIVTVISALIYNLAAGWVGGLEVEIN
jgi:hypothetical protein